MPKRTDISSILIIGAGPIVIGQACEFDYSGIQTCKALTESLRVPVKPPAFTAEKFAGAFHRTFPVGN
jgi:hypothetical protein